MVRSQILSELATLPEKKVFDKTAFEGIRPITDEGVAVGGAFDSDTAVGIMPNAHSRRLCASILAIVILRQEMRPMNAVSAVGAPLQSTIARLS
jgi:hypothetical protein